MKAMLDAAVFPLEGVRASRTAPIVVATDGNDRSNSAMEMARLLAGDAESLRLCTVLRTMPVIDPQSFMSLSAEAEIARRSGQKSMVKQQADRLWGSDPVDIEVSEGDAATIIAAAARRSNATMIVAGLGRHRVVDRVFGDETALRLVRVASVPVLAVAHAPARAPRRIVVAVDFSETSLRAARMALELAAPNALVYLTHVAPRDATLLEWNAFGASYKEDAGDALHKMRDALQIPAGISVQRLMLQGDPSTELLAFAASVQADLIATGSHGHGFVARMLVGSVTTRILRCATCSVLCVPHAAAMTTARVTASPSVATTLKRDDWSQALREFTRRNRGRRAVLEADDPDLGAQAEETRYPLIAARYDADDSQVELVLGEIGSIGRRLTRTMGDVDSIELLRNEAGAEIALRMSHGAGQTLLTLVA